MTDPQDAIRPEADHLRFLSEGRFMLQRCRTSGAFIHPPRVAEPRTGDTDLEWVEASGAGVVHSTTVMRRRDPAQDYNVALIDLAEGPRMMSRVVNVSPDQVRIGQDVKARIIEEDGRPLVVFAPV